MKGEGWKGHVHGHDRGRCQLSAQVEPDLCRAVEAFAHQETLGRSEALRRLVAEAVAGRRGQLATPVASSSPTKGPESADERSYYVGREQHA